MTLAPTPSTIANLPQGASPLAGNEFVPVSQNGVTVKVTSNQFSVVGPAGPAGPAGPTGPAGPPGAGSIAPGVINDLAFYAASGSGLSPIATANSGILVTNSGGVPSIATAIPNGVTATTQSAADNSTKVATTAYVNSATPPTHSVTNSVLAQMATNTVKVNNTGGTANAVDLNLSVSTVLGVTSGGIMEPIIMGPTITLTNSINLNVSPITNSLGGDIALNNTANYFDGPSIAQGTSGTWWVSGTVTLTDTSAAVLFDAKLWDGSTVISSAAANIYTTGAYVTISLSGYIIGPADNIRISVKDEGSTSGKIAYNRSGNSKDSTISAIRIG